MAVPHRTMVALGGWLLAALCASGCGDDAVVPGRDAAAAPGPPPAVSSDAGTPPGAGDAGDAGPAGGPGPAGGAPPSAPILLTPEDGVIDVPVESPLCWEPSVDPDGDPVRYRVYVDDLELTTGVVGGDARGGFEGPCTGPLLFNHDTRYEWFVVAFDPDHPHVMSGSPTWSFVTRWDGDGRVVFEDELFSDGGWEVSGDASDGHWTLGLPNEAIDTTPPGPFLSQPGACFRGDACWFTGQNPGGDAEQGDVDGGSTVLLSPPFDLSEALSATVSLTRFFYRGTSRDRGTRLVVELLLPDDAQPDGYRAFVLEELDYETAAELNMWRPVAFAACDLPLGADMRLRITATDPDMNVVEAGIDNVQVTGHRSNDTCTLGEGSLCNPEVPDGCGSDLLCCGQGTLNHGVHRCSVPAPAIDPEDFPAEGAERFNGELGCPLPDLVPIGWPDSVTFDEVDVRANSCAVMEGCVGGSGLRRLMRFDMASRNFGARDLTLGVPANHPDLFHYDECHEHYHFEGFATYRLLDAGGGEVARGQKLAQCLWDHSPVVWKSESGDGKFSCFNQGIRAGWQDVYDNTLDCQWIDVTDVAAGEYRVRIEVNAPTAGAAPRLVERDYGNNTIEFAVTVPDP